MKTKTSKQPKQSKRTVKDMKPKKDAAGGAGTTREGSAVGALVVDPTNPHTVY